MKKLGSAIAIILAVVSLGLSVYLFTEVRNLSQTVAILAEKVSALQETFDQTSAEVEASKVDEAKEDDVPSVVAQENSANDLVGTWTRAGLEWWHLTIMENGDFYIADWRGDESSNGHYEIVEHGYIDYNSNLLMFTGRYYQGDDSPGEYYSNLYDVPLKEISGFQTITRYGEDAIAIGNDRYTRER